MRFFIVLLILVAGCTITIKLEPVEKKDEKKTEKKTSKPAPYKRPYSPLDAKY